MPQLGESVAEGTITRWLKSEGDTVAADEPIVEISTDKVDSEIPAPMAGTLSKILAAEGETVAVGAAIAEIATDGSAPEAPEAQDAEAPSEEAPAAQEPPDAEAGPAGHPSSPEPEPAAASEPTTFSGEPALPPAPEAPLQAAAPSARPSQEGTRRILSPLVRRLAAEKKVDLETVHATGFGGRVTREDVLAAAAGPSTPASTGAARRTARPRPAAGGADEVVPITTMRKLIAEHMVASHMETARAWNTIEVDMTAVGRIRKQAGPAFKAAEGHSLTWMPFVCKAVSSALLEYPQVNSAWNGDGTITLKHYVNLGIAVALENGLIVPVIKGADQMNILGLSRSIRDVAERARSKRLSPDEVTGGTFSITNPGSFGSLMSVPIINKGQSGILSFDAIAKRPVVVTDEYGQDSIAIRERVFISLSWDHRVIDGAEAAQFLSALRLILEEADFQGDLEAFLR